MTHAFDTVSLPKKIPGLSNEGDPGRYPPGDAPHRNVPVLSCSSTKGIAHFHPPSPEGSGKNDPRADGRPVGEKHSLRDGNGIHKSRGARGLEPLHGVPGHTAAPETGPEAGPGTC